MYRRALIGTAAVVAGCLASGGVAAAGGDSVPTLKAATSKSGPFSDVSAELNLRPGKHKNFSLKLKNGGASGAIRLDGPASDGIDEATFRYFKGKNEITAAVTGMGKVFDLDAGAVRIIRVRARLSQAADDSDYGAFVNAEDVESPIHSNGVTLLIENPEGH